MAHRACVARWSAFTVAMIFTLAGTAFVVAGSVAEFGAWQGSAISALWLAPTGAACALAWVRPRAASWLLHAGLVALLAGWAVFILQADLLPAFDGYEELLAVGGFALGIPAGVIGVHRPRTAAFLLGMIALTPVVAVALADAVVVDAVVVGGSSGLGAVTTAAWISAAAQLVTAGLFLLAWRLGHPADVGAPGSSAQADRSGHGGNRLLESRS